jgi:hypothetical protein
LFFLEKVPDRTIYGRCLGMKETWYRIHNPGVFYPGLEPWALVLKARVRARVGANLFQKPSI